MPATSVNMFLICWCLSASALDLPDIWHMVEQPALSLPMVKQPDVVLPTVRQIDHMKRQQEQRKHWFFSAFFSVFVCIMVLGTSIMTIVPRLKMCCTPSQDNQPLFDLSVGRQKQLMTLMFGISLTTVAAASFWAMKTNRLSKTTGLDWEIYLFLFCLVGQGLVLQAILAVIRLPAGKTFSLATFPEACFTAMFPLLSDYFDTLKDCIFSMLCLASHHIFIQAMGVISFVYLVLIHVFFIFRRPNCLAELTGTYLPLITAPPADTALCANNTSESDTSDSETAFVLKRNISANTLDSEKTEPDADTWQSGICGSLSRFIVPLLYKQVTPTKRELLLWENVPQAIGSIIFLLAEGGSKFVMVVNLLIPICQVVATFVLFRPLRQAMGPDFGKKLGGAMDVGDYVKARHILEEVPWVYIFWRSVPGVD